MGEGARECPSGMCVCGCYFQGSQGRLPGGGVLEGKPMLGRSQSWRSLSGLGVAEGRTAS